MLESARRLFLDLDIPQLEDYCSKKRYNNECRLGNRPAVLHDRLGVQAQPIRRESRSDEEDVDKRYIYVLTIYSE